MARSPDTPPLFARRLPLPTGPLVGRVRELHTLKSWLRREDTQLITLCGPAGVGKTHLALALGAQLPTDIAVATFVDLTAVSGPEEVLSTVLDACGLHGDDRNSPLERLAQALQGAPPLLILDNFEHVLGAAPFVRDLFGMAPAARLLVTSRHALGLPQEHVFEVRPLAPPSGVVPTVRDIAASPAVRLFVRRAQDARPSFTLNQHNAFAVAQVVAHLDGLPLALELAAARMGLLTPQALLARLALPETLTKSSNEGVERHRSLDAALSWSFDLIEPVTQALLARLSVPRGDFSLELAEALDQDGTPEVLTRLEALADLHLLDVRHEDGGEVRLRVLETIRAFALRERPQDAADARARYTQYVLALARRAEGESQGARQTERLDRLEREYHHLRAVLAVSLEGGDAEVGLHLAAALSRFWVRRGHLREGRTWCERLLTLPGIEAPDLRAGVLGALGSLALWQHDFHAAEQAFTEALALRRTMNDVGGQAGALGNLALVRKGRGDLAGAQHAMEGALAVFRSLGDERHVATALLNLGVFTMHQRAWEAAETYYTEALSLYRRQGNLANVSETLHGLGAVAFERGDPERARTLMQEAVVVAREVSAPGTVIAALVNFALLLDRTGDAPAASPFVREALALSVASGHLNQGRLLLVLQARQSLLAGRAGAAAEWLGAAQAQAVREAASDHAEDTRLLLEDARRALGAESFGAAFARGETLPLLAALTAADSTPASAQNAWPELTPREREVLGLLVAGRANKDIGRMLGISTYTAREHVSAILGKLGVRSRARAAVLAAQRGLLD